MTTRTFLAQAEEIKLSIRTRILNSTVTVMFLTNFAFGGTVPGRWEKVANLPKGESVIVFLKSGERLDGRLQSLATNELVFERAPGEVSALRKQDIARILSTDIVEDSTRNGTLIGAGTGFGAGFLAAVARLISDNENSRSTTIRIPVFFRLRTDHVRHGHRSTSEEIDEAEKDGEDVGECGRKGRHGREDGQEMATLRETTESEKGGAALAHAS